MAAEPDWFSFLGADPPAPAGPPGSATDTPVAEDTSAAGILRRAIRKAADEALAAPTGASGSTVHGSPTRSKPASADEDSSGEHSSASSASSSSSEGTAMLDTPGNRRLMSAIQAKDKKKKKPSPFGAALSGGATSGDPRPVPLRTKFAETRSYYVPVTYPDADQETSSDGDTSDDFRPTKPECFLCGWGDEFHDGIEAPLVRRLNGIIEVYYGKAENAAVAQMLRLFYMRKIYDRDAGMPELTQETALEHIEGLHTLEPRIAIGELIKRYMRFLAVLEDNVFYTNNGFNRHAMSAYNASVRMVMTLYKMNPATMNFYNPKLDIDLKKMGAFTNLMENFTNKKKPRRDAEHNHPPPPPPHASKRPRDEDSTNSDRASKRARSEERMSQQSDAMDIDTPPVPPGDSVLAPPDDQMLI